MKPEQRLANAIVDLCNFSITTANMQTSEILTALWKTSSLWFIHLTAEETGLIVQSDKDYFMNCMSVAFDEVIKERNLKIEEPN